MWRIVKLTGWDLATIDSTPARLLDELLAVDAAVNKGQADAQERANGG